MNRRHLTPIMISITAYTCRRCNTHAVNARLVDYVFDYHCGTCGNADITTQFIAGNVIGDKSELAQFTGDIK